MQISKKFEKKKVSGQKLLKFISDLNESLEYPYISRMWETHWFSGKSVQVMVTVAKKNFKTCKNNVSGQQLQKLTSDLNEALRYFYISSII